MPLVPLATQSLPGSEPYSGERLVNYFAQQSAGVSPVVLLSRGGLVELVRLTAEPVRALTTMGGAIYAVSDGTVWKIVGATATNVGSVPDGVTEIAASATQVAIVAGGFYYVCDGTTTSLIGTGSVSQVVGLTYLDGYFVVIGSSAGRPDAFTVSRLDNGTIFDALDFAFAEKSPDALTAVVRDHDRLWLMGQDTAQLFYNAGGADFPLQPVPGSTLEHGCRPRTLAKAANLVYWVKPSGTVMASGGSDPQVISTPEIQEEINGSTIVRAFSFHERGHEFYCITRDKAPALVYDISTGLWAERSSGVNDGPWLPQCSTQLDGVDYVGCVGGHVATMEDDVFTDLGDVMRGEVVTKPFQPGADRFSISRLHVNFAGGNVDIGRTPQVSMQTSEDARTWRQPRWRDLANLGSYYKRATWHALGQFRRVNVRLRISDPVPRDMTGGTFE